MTETTTGQVHAAVAAVMAEVGGVEKGRKNLQQGYQFRGIADLYLACQPVMAKHKIHVTPHAVLDEVATERQSKTGGAIYHIRQRIEFRFYHADGSWFSCVTTGEAMDSGDKTANKVMSAAMKYALIQTFAIPEQDPDADTESASPEPLPQSAKPEPERKPARKGEEPPKAPPVAAKPATNGKDAEHADAIAKLKNCVGNELKWEARQASERLAGPFGVAKVSALTKAQAMIALQLAFAAVDGQEQYDAALAKARAQHADLFPQGSGGVIRPSSLSIAKHCMLAPALSDLFPSRSEGTDRGQAVDRQVTDEHSVGVVATDPDARACLAWMRTHLKGAVTMQERLRLLDPDTGGLLTEGTTDIAHVHDGVLDIVDLKKREQWLAGRLSAPDANLQLHAYALAKALAEGHRTYRLCLLLFGDGQAEPMWSETAYTEETWTPVLDEIRAIQARQTPDPKPVSGPHCVGCWPRLHCPSWTIAGAPGELAPLSQPGGLTKDNVGKALVASLALKEIYYKAKEQLEAWVDVHGPIVVGNRQWGPVKMPGQARVDVDALDKAGLYERFARTGDPYRQFRWGKAK